MEHTLINDLEYFSEMDNSSRKRIWVNLVSGHPNADLCIIG